MKAVFVFFVIGCLLSVARYKMDHDPYMHGCNTAPAFVTPENCVRQMFRNEERRQKPVRVKQLVIRVRAASRLGTALAFETLNDMPMCGALSFRRQSEFQQCRLTEEQILGTE